MNERGRLGRSGEDAAARFLESAGMRVLEKRWRCPFGELDLVAVEGGTLVFVEVKTRRSSAFGSAESAVTPGKQGRMARAALAFAGARGLLGMPMRFDVVAVQGGELRHLRDAFRVGGYTR